MKKHKISKISIGVGVLAMGLMTGVNLLDANAQTSGGIVCDCSVLWLSGCRADYWGFQCAPDGQAYCNAFDKNCG